MCWLSWNVGASTSWNPQGLSRPVMGLLHLYHMISSPFTAGIVTVQRTHWSMTTQKNWKRRHIGCTGLTAASPVVSGLDLPFELSLQKNFHIHFFYQFISRFKFYSYIIAMISVPNISSEYHPYPWTAVVDKALRGFERDSFFVYTALSLSIKTAQSSNPTFVMYFLSSWRSYAVTVLHACCHGIWSLIVYGSVAETLSLVLRPKGGVSYHMHRGPTIYIQGVYKLSEDFAKSYFHKYWTEIHDATIWKRNVYCVIVT
jgi:hypothetical protein